MHYIPPRTHDYGTNCRDSLLKHFTLSPLKTVETLEELISW